ncbi:V-type ATP synthase subunit F [Pyrococcus furiosus DSM 3638]|uniref:A-type ATP synthase subunit F n=4 Tax=Pyrococcus furiosus TaxID=2261 RepID=AATF_PYRFU|nr:V-type ATP synthase subunit F [Pyrococcus furiosus]Q8U4A7.1 RecName: Full=V-type ATP synthase subunit F; AltName: Full=V-ATPase subunit F [Pyrococcus furiosus DSM 3638]AAL80305.1 ATPase subunit F [Pyrococcus furiosus DSM 3638]AFN04395.1 V-type ATP synthase subunit F [Pyrococcus furiosus COM1]QEK77908.1 V-type ATP synthase subunit F [Pyrococcus furiosus DSM 3638]
MKIVVMGDSDTVVGFRLAGVHEAYEYDESLESVERARNKLRELLERDDVGIILITERLAQRIGSLPEVKFPIILQIPDKFGSIYGEDILRDVVRRAIGVELKR